jgi:spore coat protein U-like protein
MRRDFVRTVLGFAAVGAVVAGVSSSAVFAANESANLVVNATVTNNCTIATSSLNFGSYDPVVANLTADVVTNGQMLIACTKGASATVVLGNGGGSAPDQRRLANGTNYLPYQLYKQDGSTVWSSASPVSYTSTTKAQSPLTLVGKIPAGADIPAGSYTDTVVATINF